MVYEKLRGSVATIPWEKAVWTVGGIPKHNFLTWLFVLNRSPTRDRMIHWGLQVDPSCLLCNAAAESRDHLFFNCSYSWMLWTELARRYNHQPDQDWSRGLLRMQANILEGSSYLDGNVRSTGCGKRGIIGSIDPNFAQLMHCSP